jgi:hypothetical protein
MHKTRSSCSTLPQMKPTEIALTLSLVAFVSLGTRGIVAQNSDARLKARIDHWRPVFGRRKRFAR